MTIVTGSMLNVKSVIYKGCPFICKFPRSYHIIPFWSMWTQKLASLESSKKLDVNLWYEYPINQHCNNVGIINFWCSTWNEIPQGLPEVSIDFNKSHGYELYSVIIVTEIITLPIHVSCSFTVTTCRCTLKSILFAWTCVLVTLASAVASDDCEEWCRCSNLVHSMWLQDTSLLGLVKNPTPFCWLQVIT